MNSHHILLYSTYDSFINTGINLCLETFNKNPDCIYIHKKKHNQVSDKQAKNIPYKYKNIRLFFLTKEIENFDVIILSFGIKQHVLFNHQLIHYHKILSIPLIISCMPGTGFNRPENFLCRLYSDILLLNCSKDYNEFIESSDSYKFRKKNGFLYGLPQIKSSLLHKYEDNKIPASIAYFDQLIVPNNKKDKRLIADNLINYAIKFPKRKVYIKPRVSLSETTFHSQNLNILNIINKYYKNNMPANVILTDLDIPHLVQITDLCVTVSSTVAIEYLAYGRQAVLISDFGINKKLLNNFYSGSGIFTSFKQLLSDDIPTVDREWFDSYVRIPKDRVLKLKQLVNDKKTLLNIRNFTKITYSSNIKRLNHSYMSKLIDIAIFKLSLITGKSPTKTNK